MLDKNGEDLVEVWNYPTLASAEVGRHSLSVGGIESDIFGANVDHMYMTAIGGISLMVKRKDLESAKGILNSVVELSENVVREEEEIRVGTEFCTNCHSIRIKSRQIEHYAHPIYLVNIWKSVFGYKKAFYCRDCKSTWKK